VVLDFSRPGKPTDNAFILRRGIDPLDQFLTLLTFNSHFRAECLNQHWFLTLADAAEKLEASRRYYNEERPYGAIGNRVPIKLTKSWGVTSPPP
jgi:transposase InsO family protein